MIISSGQSSGDNVGEAQFFCFLLTSLNMNFFLLVVTLAACSSVDSPSLLSETDDLSSGNNSCEDLDDCSGLSGTKNLGFLGPKIIIHTL